MFQLVFVYKQVTIHIVIVLDSKTVRRVTGLTQHNLNYLADTGAIRTIIPGKRNRRYLRDDIVRLINEIRGEE